MTRRPDEEHDLYRDTGCALWHACLSCPFPVCGEELPGGIPALRRRLTYQVVAWLLEDGVHPRDIASRLGFTQRHVLRIKAALQRQPDVWRVGPFRTTPGRRPAAGPAR